MVRLNASLWLLVLALAGGAMPGCATPAASSTPPVSGPPAPAAVASTPAAAGAHTPTANPTASAGAPATSTATAPPSPPQAPRTWNLGTPDAVDMARLGELVGAFQDRLLDGQLVDLSAPARALGAEPREADRLEQVAPWRAEQIEANLDEDGDLERVVDIVACGTADGAPPDTTPDPSFPSAKQCRGYLIHLVAWLDPGPTGARALGYQQLSLPYDVNGDASVTVRAEPVHTDKHQDTILRTRLRLEAGTTEVTDEIHVYALRKGRIEKILDHQSYWTHSHVGGNDVGHPASMALVGKPPRVLEVTDDVTGKKTRLRFDPTSFRYR
ncbi:uncharacterized protein SOCE26_037140 [Sorangium cellulosum]|uniref:Secreted protein n=1 Tax=Sorangium cellulosum TaxID=56 RepID=A0A2L0ESM8_SORCE|nr:hypothetical protein [Sorangium cellulosum]AUX42284.1 uncharacterized protein SOCE26_037140 [Sorangium cellulosum]